MSLMELGPIEGRTAAHGSSDDLRRVNNDIGDATNPEAARVRQTPPNREGRLLRFVLAERLAHWTYAAFFLSALVSGLLMWIPSTRNLISGSRQAFSHLHGVIGALMIGVPLLILLVLNRRQLSMDMREIDMWDADDTAWFWRAVRGYTLLQRPMPPQGRFNAGQKASSILVAALAVGFAVTGSILLAGPHVSAWLVSRALVLHQILAVAGITLFVTHVFHALTTRHGRDSLRAMAHGTMSETVAREHHEKWWRRQMG